MRERYIATSYSYESLVTAEQRIHLLKRPLSGLWQRSPEEHSVSEVANDKGKEVVPLNVLHSDGRDLSDKRVESEGSHDTDRAILRASHCVEDLSGNDP